VHNVIERARLLKGLFNLKVDLLLRALKTTKIISHLSFHLSPEAKQTPLITTSSSHQRHERSRQKADKK